MKSLTSEITINAGPDAVWSVLTDFDSYPEWNPFIVSIAGAKNVGGRLVVNIRPPGSRSMTFKPVVIAFEPEKEFRWKGKLLIKGLFDGEHRFKLKDNHDGTTQFQQGEDFSGLLVGMTGKTLDQTHQGFVLMNEALKKRCEAKPDVSD